MDSQEHYWVEAFFFQRSILVFSDWWAAPSAGFSGPGEDDRGKAPDEARNVRWNLSPEKGE